MSNYNLCFSISNLSTPNPVFSLQAISGTPTSALQIRQISADGFSDSGCTTLIGSMQYFAANTTYPAGSTPQVNISPQNITGIWFNAHFATVTSVVISGTSGTHIVTNGQVITNGGDTVTIYLPSCQGVNENPCFFPIPNPTPTATIQPSPTPTPTITPTSTLVPKPTATPTSTPTSTPTPTPTATSIFQSSPNDCAPITLFEMGVQCDAIEPTFTTSLDGSIYLLITGGTEPYTITWNTGQQGQFISNLSAGTYISTVVDFYGDFTAVTTCTLIAPTPTPTSTLTPTPTPTSTPVFDSLCMFIDCSNFAEWTFNPGSVYVNNQPTWNGTGGASGYTIVWNTGATQNNWLVSGFTLFDIISPVSSAPPISGWKTLGAQHSVIVTDGACNGILPLVSTANINNPSCNGACDGAILINVSCGTPPYTYSIDGINFQPSPVFNGLCQGTYTTYTRNSATTVSQTTVLTSGNNIDTYNLSFTTNLLNVKNTSNEIENSTVYHLIVKDSGNNVVTTLPAGVLISFTLVIEDTFAVFGPGTGNNNGSVLEVIKDSIELVPTSSATTITTTPNLNCSGQTIQTTTLTNTYDITLSTIDNIAGSLVSDILIDSPVTFNGCTTTLNEKIVMNITNLKSNCDCCTIENNASITTINNLVNTQPANYIANRVTTPAQGSSINACTASLLSSGTLLIYVSIVNNFPTVGLQLYTNSTLTNKFIGATGWIGILWAGTSGNGSRVALNIDVNGVVLNVDTC